MIKQINNLKWTILILAICIGAFWLGLQSACVMKVKKEPALVAKPILTESITKEVTSTKEAKAKIIIKSKLDKKQDKKKDEVVLLGKVTDPFQVDFSVQKKDAQNEATVTPKKYFVLQGSFVAGKKSVALIDDEILGIGDYIHGWKVVGIKKDVVGLKRWKEIKRLKLDWGG